MTETLSKPGIVMCGQTETPCKKTYLGGCSNGECRPYTIPESRARELYEVLPTAQKMLTERTWDEAFRHPVRL